MTERISVAKAIMRGLVVVNGPVLPLTLAPMLVLAPFMSVIETAVGQRAAITIFLSSIVAGGLIAWRWWAIAVPKWRLWAYERVTDIPTLKRWAVRVGLTWPDGHPFENTEIKSNAHAARERELERERA
jgi:hypothetical protein